MSDALIASLRNAVGASPEDHVLRLHLAETLLTAGYDDEAIVECATVLAGEPGDPAAVALMRRAMGPDRGAPDLADGSQEPERGHFDWRAAEKEVDDIAAPMFVTTSEDAHAELGTSAWDVENAGITLDDVGGMQAVKDRLEAAFLAPMRNPELRKQYGKSLRGGLLMYGPPGCGKTFIARAVAGELGAKFVTVGLADILDMYVGNSERNIAELFRLVRQNAPCVLFLDDVDALGQKRSSTRNTAMRGAVVQLLTELDGLAGNNEGVFVLAATNQPWDVDSALRRPGRFDRTLLVLPPDHAAREAIFRYHLRHRPVEGIDLAKLADITDGFTGADIYHICETASERALLDSARSGIVRMIGMDDLLSARDEIRPSAGPWFETARNVVMFADPDGAYSDLREYMKRSKRL